MNSKESTKDKPEDIAFKNSVINRLSNLESDYNMRREKQDKENKISTLAKRNLGRHGRDIEGLGSLQGFESGLGNPTKLNTRKNG